MTSPRSLPRDKNSSATNHDEQKRIEREVFGSFCTATGLRVVPGSLRQPAPPAPDIIVGTADRGEVAFELTDISPATEIHRHRVLHRVTDVLIEYINDLPLHVQKEFDRKYANALIVPSMLRLKGDRDLRKHVPAVFELLQSLPDDFEGTVARAELPAQTQSLGILRQEEIRGPLFQSIGAALLPRLNITALSSKFSKKYEVTCRCELLAWIGNGGIFHEEDEKELPEMIRTSISSSIFESIWVFDMGAGTTQRFDR